MVGPGQNTGEVSLYSWLKKLCQFITSLFFLVDTPTHGRAKYHIEKNLKHSCFRSELIEIMERYMVFTTDGFFEIAIEIWPEWDLNPQPLNSVFLFVCFITKLLEFICTFAVASLAIKIKRHLHVS